MNAPLFARSGLWLCLPVVVLGALDAGLTLHGQSEFYWSGDHTHVNELSPSPKDWLEIGPLTFVAGFAGWLIVACALILLLPEVLALCAAVSIVIGHAFGAASWLVGQYEYGYQACNVLLFFTALVIVLAFKRGQNPGGGAAFNWQRTGLPGWLRWLVVACLAAAPVWLFVIPR